MNIKLVRFNSGVMVGQEVKMVTYLNNEYISASGEKVFASRVDDHPVKMTFHNDVFLRVDFGNAGYSQLVPWTHVATVIFDESKKK